MRCSQVAETKFRKGNEMRKGCLLVSLLCSAIVTSAAPVGSIKGYVVMRAEARSQVHRSRSAMSSPKSPGKRLRTETVSISSSILRRIVLHFGRSCRFRKGIVRSVSVLLNQVVALDLTLSIGTVNEVVEVVGGVNTLIEPDKVSTGVNFDPTLTARCR